MNSISSESVKSMCRVCLARGDHSKRIDLDAEEDAIPKFSEFFTLLTTLEQDNKFPNRICKNCTGRVIDAYKVRKLAQSSDSIIRFIANLPEHSRTKSVCEEPDLKGNNNEELIKAEKNVCPVCAKSFPYKSELQRHKETHEPHYKCSTCDKVFGFKSSLRRHERQHERISRVPCSHCSSFFKDEALLKRHIQYAHQGKKYACVVCGVKCGSAGALRTHSERHTAEGGKALQCQYRGCNKTFSLCHQLTRHQAVHTGAKKFYCDHCGKGFVQAHHLVSHMAKHKPELRIKCTEMNCGKSFPTKYALKKHIVIHEKAKLICKNCNKVVLTTRNLRAHEQRCKTQQHALHADSDADLKMNQSPDNLLGDRHSPEYTNELQNKRHRSNPNLKISHIIENCNATSASINTQFNSIKQTISDATVNISNNESNQDVMNENPNKNDTSDNKYCEESNEISSKQNLTDNVHSLYKDNNSHGGLDVSMQHCHCTSSAESCSRKLNTNIEDVLKSTDCSSCYQKSDRRTPFESDQITQTQIKWISQVDTQNINIKVDGVEMQGNDCKGFLGNCIVGNGSDVANEECICAKVKYEVPVPEYLTTPLLTALEKQGYYHH